MTSEIRRSMPVLPMSIVMQLTDLTARQIRYYEQHELIKPHRTDGKRRMFSLHDVDILLEIKSMLERGAKMVDIKRTFTVKKEANETQQQEISDRELRKIMRDEMLQARSMQKPSIRQGSLSRFPNQQNFKK